VVALAIYLEPAALTGTSRARVDWMVRHRNNVVLSTARTVQGGSGGSVNRFTQVFAPKQAGRYVFTARATSNGTSLGVQTATFAAQPGAATKGVTLRSASGLDITLRFARESRWLAVVPGGPYEAARKGQEFLLTQWYISNSGTAAVALRRFAVQVAGMVRPGSGQGPYLAKLPPSAAQSMIWIFRVPANSHVATLVYPVLPAARPPRLAWTIYY
jgi:hypothetical protein